MILLRLLLMGMIASGIIYCLLWACFYHGWLTKQRLKTLNRVITVGVLTAIILVVAFCFIQTLEL